MAPTPCTPRASEHEAKLVLSSGQRILGCQMAAAGKPRSEWENSAIERVRATGKTSPGQYEGRTVDEGWRRRDDGSCTWSVRRWAQVGSRAQVSMDVGDAGSRETEGQRKARRERQPRKTGLGLVGRRGGRCGGPPRGRSTYGLRPQGRRTGVALVGSPAGEQKRV